MAGMCSFTYCYILFPFNNCISGFVWCIFNLDAMKQLFFFTTKSKHRLMNGWYIYIFTYCFIQFPLKSSASGCVQRIFRLIKNKLTEAPKCRYINWLIIISLTPYICIYVSNFSGIPLYSRVSRCLQHIFDMVMKAPESRHVYSIFFVIY